MNWIFYLAPLSLAFLISALIVILAWRRRRTPGVIPFAILMAAIAEWCLGNIMELLSPTLAGKILWVKIEYLGIVAIPALYFIVILFFTGSGSKIKPWIIGALAIEPIMVLGLVWTNDFHHFFWHQFRLVTVQNISFLISGHHYGFWAHAAYSYFLIFTGVAVLIMALVRFNKLYRGQVGIILIGGGAPLIGNLLYILHIGPLAYFDVTPFAFAISGLAFGWGLINFQLFQIVPIARELIIDHMTDSVFVLDISNRVIDINLTALRLAGLSQTQVIGKPVRFVFSNWETMVDRFNEVQQTEEEISVGEGENCRYFEIRISPLYQKNHFLGRLVIIHEITERKKVANLQTNLDKLQRTIDDTVHVIAQIIEMRDPYTAGHQKRVTKLACAIGEEMGLPAETIATIRVASLCHDIGKISIPVEILNKPGRLTDIEFELIRTHPAVGFDILKDVEFPRPIARIVLQHHERLNGSGYPGRLLDPDILIEAKIIGVADVVEAMSNDRPYRPALGIDMAVAEITKNSGSLYEPKVVDACIRLIKEKGYQF